MVLGTRGADRRAPVEVRDNKHSAPGEKTSIGTVRPLPKELGTRRDPSSSHLDVRVGKRRFVARFEGTGGKAAVSDASVVRCSYPVRGSNADPSANPRAFHLGPAGSQCGCRVGE